MMGWRSRSKKTVMDPPVKPPWTKEEFERQLRAKGTRYHLHHPFHIAMNGGQCTKAQVQGWVYNRYYYQISIPLKDASILANMPDRDQRRQWILRIIDHDGTQADEGGIEAWLRLGDACGLKREDMQSLNYVLPGVRFAVDAYVNFARHARWQEAVCSSLTELFAPEIHKKRLENWPHHYRFQWGPAQQMHVLLYPEGMVQLPGSSGEILKRVNGAARVGEIVADLERAFPGADLRGDVIEFLEHAHGKGWIRTKQG